MIKASTATTPAPRHDHEGVDVELGDVVADLERETLELHDRVDEGVEVAGGAAARAAQELHAAGLFHHGAAWALVNGGTRNATSSNTSVKMPPSP